MLKLEDKRYARSKNLSGGIKKKLQVGGALIGGSNILILDEPSSGLDIEALRMMWDLLLSFRKGYLILFTTHNMEEVNALGERIAIMHAGEDRCCGSPGFLKEAFRVAYSLTIFKNGDSTKLKTLVKMNSALQNWTTKQQLKLFTRFRSRNSTSYQSFWRNWNPAWKYGRLNHLVSKCTLWTLSFLGHAKRFSLRKMPNLAKK